VHDVREFGMDFGGAEQYVAGLEGAVVEAFADAVDHCHSAVFWQLVC
jgi:hypothetical protein